MEYDGEDGVMCMLVLIGIWDLLQAAIGGWHCLAVDEQGRAYAWGM